MSPFLSLWMDKVCYLCFNCPSKEKKVAFISWTQERSTTEGANTSILFHQKFSPKGRIFLPDNLIWYNNNHSVIRLYEQRLHGNLLEHQEKIEITTNKIIESQELETIQAEFKNVISSVKGSYSESVSEELKINKSETLSIRIKFCNLNNGEVVGNFKNKLISNFGQKIIKQYFGKFLPIN